MKGELKLLLNQRQLEIVLELFENPDTYMTASYFSNKHQCSLRTIQNDIKQIKLEMSSVDCVTLNPSREKDAGSSSGTPTSSLH